MVGLLRRTDHVLLCQRHPQPRWYPNVWDLPGGHVQPQGDPFDALQQELHEELGITIAPRGKHADLHLRDGDLRLRCWIIDQWAGQPTNLAPEEHDRITSYSHTDARTLPLAHARYVDLIERALHPDPSVQTMQRPDA